MMRLHGYLARGNARLAVRYRCHSQSNGTPALASSCERLVETAVEPLRQYEITQWSIGLRRMCADIRTVRVAGAETRVRLRPPRFQTEYSAAKPDRQISSASTSKTG
jgi:hypothetical protein